MCGRAWLAGARIECPAASAKGSDRFTTGVLGARLVAIPGQSAYSKKLTVRCGQPALVSCVSRTARS